MQSPLKPSSGKISPLGRFRQANFYFTESCVLRIQKKMVLSIFIELNNLCFSQGLSHSLCPKRNDFSKTCCLPQFYLANPMFIYL